VKQKGISLIKVFFLVFVPASLYWILYRYGFLPVIDTLAAGVLVAAGFVFGLKWLFSKRVIKFGK
jgi:hypothetical protein